jgi:hypothetical protein
MIKIILSFLILFGVFFFGFKVINKMTKMEKWTLTKYTVYSMLCSLLALGALTIFVVLF